MQIRRVNFFLFARKQSLTGAVPLCATIRDKINFLAAPCCHGDFREEEVLRKWLIGTERRRPWNNALRPFAVPIVCVIISVRICFMRSQYACDGKMGSIQSSEPRLFVFYQDEYFQWASRRSLLKTFSYSMLSPRCSRYQASLCLENFRNSFPHWVVGAGFERQAYVC